MENKRLLGYNFNDLGLKNIEAVCAILQLKPTESNKTMLIRKNHMGYQMSAKNSWANKLSEAGVLNIWCYEVWEETEPTKEHRIESLLSNIEKDITEVRQLIKQ